jgi:hypothetical protein
MTTMNKEAFNREIESRFLEIFNAYANGQDVAPAQLYRAEGFCEAGCYLSLATEAELIALMKKIHRQVFNTELSGSNQSGGGVRIPSLMKRAPVYPSGK